MSPYKDKLDEKCNLEMLSFIFAVLDQYEKLMTKVMSVCISITNLLVFARISMNTQFLMFTTLHCVEYK